jgi:cysteine desulfurase
MGVPAERLRSSVRFSLGAFTTDEEIEEAARRVVGVVGRLAGKESGMNFAWEGESDRLQ